MEDNGERTKGPLEVSLARHEDVTLAAGGIS